MPQSPSHPSGSLEASLEVTPRVAAPPQEVHFRLRVTNESDEEVIVEAGGCPTDTVVRAGEREVWRASENRFCILIVQGIRFSPRESRTYEEDWDLRDNEGRLLPPGEYSVTMEFPDRKPPRATSPAVKLTIRPPNGDD